MRPSVLNPPGGRSHRFLLPAASVQFHGAQRQGAVDKPAIYPNRHIYVLEGSTSPVQDGTRAHPYGSLEEVLKDGALRAMCATIAADFYHIHLKSAKAFAFEEASGEIQAFDGGGFDFHGRLVIENWPGERCGLSFTARNTTVLTPLSTDGYGTTGFHAKRHGILSGASTDANAALFRNFRNVLFHGIDANVTYHHGYSGYECDRYGNNSPISEIPVRLRLSAWNSCHGCGLHLCTANVSASISLQPPDPMDIQSDIEPEIPGDGSGGGSGGGGGGGGGGSGGGGSISGGGGGFVAPGYGWGGIEPEEVEEEIPACDEFALAPVSGSIRVALAMAMDCRRMRCAGNTANVTASASTVFGAVIESRGYSGCTEKFSRRDSLSLSSRAVDREYVYTFRSEEDGALSDVCRSLSQGAAANAFAYGEAGSFLSTLSNENISALADARAERSELVDTEEPFARTSARAVCHQGCTDSAIVPGGSSFQARASSPWTHQTEETAQEMGTA